ncbi:MAG: hypothetical protein ACRD3C_12835 [Vicinamibacterales bacterium]
MPFAFFVSTESSFRVSPSRQFCSVTFFNVDPGNHRLAWKPRGSTYPMDLTAQMLEYSGVASR